MTAHAAGPSRAARPVPLLVTVDVEIAHDRDPRAQAAALGRLADDPDMPPATWFCTAEAAEAFAAPLRTLARRGHSIGCHGLDHGAWEDYRHLDRRSAHAAIDAATRRIEAAVGVRPRLFRGPRMTTSADTQQSLVELGYIADFSVCTRRLDPFAASAYQWQWLSAPVRPYHPSPSDPFRCGRRPLTVVPLSGWGAPFVSGVLYTAGGAAMRRLARRVADQAARCKAPVVYLFHSYEFTDVVAGDRRPWHQRLYRGDPAARFRLNAGLLRWLVDDLKLTARPGMDYLADKGARHDQAGHNRARRSTAA